MGSTNFTPNYSLPQFIGTDKPAWLTDVNTAYSAIDTAIKNAADDATAASNAASTASGVATGAATLARTLDTQINTPSTGIAAVVSQHTTDITDINNLLGSVPLTTVAQTVTGAIEEVKASIPVITGELQFLGTIEIRKNYDGVMSVADGMNAAFTDLVAAYTALQPGEYIRVIGGRVGLVSDVLPSTDLTLGTTVPSNIIMQLTQIATAEIRFYYANFSSNSSSRACVGSLTVTDNSAAVPTSGAFCFIRYEKYKVVS